MNAAEFPLFVYSKNALADGETAILLFGLPTESKGFCTTLANWT
jgi:hypothetical protein